MKMFLTRLGEGSRMVITGDRSQVDLPRGVASGLHDAERLLKTIPDIAFQLLSHPKMLSDIPLSPPSSRLMTQVNDWTF